MGGIKKEQKLCIDCKHYRLTKYSESKCMRKAVNSVNVVTGEMDKVCVENCEWERLFGIFLATFHGECGREGRFFERKVN